MAFQPADSLKSRTFIGLLVAQFLAAFNDQAIHASAMFFAINTKTLSEAQAISLMPILFYAPWALFCTLAGFLADRFSKQYSLVFWKLAEVGITFLALAGFWLGRQAGHGSLGPWIVLSTVFLMGTHSAFFVPAKYGAMPEILQPHLLSKGNGLLESLSFLAVILGTVCGGVLSYYFQGREFLIGVILLILAGIGAVASFLIARIPAANPTRPFPVNLFKPLYHNIRILLRSRPLALAVVGIAFFTFVVAFMRQTVYMLGESQVPRWTELKTSIIVGMSALGIGLGSPLAGLLSGGKVELGLVPLGAVGMILFTVAAAFTLHWLPGLIACIILIGFFTGFFIVPLFTLLQHRAPKTSKGDAIATSNFINVTGAILASLFFFVLVFAAQRLGLAPRADQRDNVFAGTLVKDIEMNRHGRPVSVELKTSEGQVKQLDARPPAADLPDEDDEAVERIEVEENFLDVFGTLKAGSEVVVSTYELPPTQYRPRRVVYYKVRPAPTGMKVAYDNEGLPGYLFLGAGFMTLLTLLALCRQLPDLFVRSLLWLRSQGRHHLHVVGIPNLPGDGPIILATNCDTVANSLHVVAATDRYIRFILLQAPENGKRHPLLDFLTRQTGLVTVRLNEDSAKEWDAALNLAAQTLREGNMIGLTVEGRDMEPDRDRFLNALRGRSAAAILPVWCGPAVASEHRAPQDAAPRRVRVVFGHVLPVGVSVEEVRRQVRELGHWVRQTDLEGDAVLTAKIPAAAGALPKGTAEAPPLTP